MNVSTIIEQNWNDSCNDHKNESSHYCMSEHVWLCDQCMGTHQKDHSVIPSYQLIQMATILAKMDADNVYKKSIEGFKKDIDEVLKKSLAFMENKVQESYKLIISNINNLQLANKVEELMKLLSICCRKLPDLLAIKSNEESTLDNKKNELMEFFNASVSNHFKVKVKYKGSSKTKISSFQQISKSTYQEKKVSKKKSNSKLLLIQTTPEPAVKKDDFTEVNKKPLNESENKQEIPIEDTSKMEIPSGDTNLSKQELLTEDINSSNKEPPTEDPNANNKQAPIEDTKPTNQNALLNDQPIEEENKNYENAKQNESNIQTDQISKKASNDDQRSSSSSQKDEEGEKENELAEQISTSQMQYSITKSQADTYIPPQPTSTVISPESKTTTSAIFESPKSSESVVKIRGKVFNIFKKKTLDLGSINLGDDGVQQLCTFLETNQTLQSISLWSNKITDQGAAYIAEMLKVNKTLKSINLCI